MVQRLTYRRRHAYNTKSNRVRTIKTPGGKLQFQYVKKKASPTKCGDCKQKLNGVVNLRPKEEARVSKRCRRVSRVYGGSRCHTCVRQRIIRAFLIEEHKIVKHVLKLREQQEKKKSKGKSKK